MSATKAKPFTKIFVLEDDLWYSQFLTYHLSHDTTHEVVAFSSVNDFLRRLSEAPDIVTLDYHLPDCDGENILNRVLEVSPGTYTIVISGQEDISKAVNTIKQGAYDYIVKNEDTKERLWSIVEKIKQHITLRSEIEALRKEVKPQNPIRKEIVGSSELIEKATRLIEKAANSSINLLITGETGTGKEFVARAVHRHSSRRGKPFVSVNLSGLSGEALDAELYGPDKGAFAGAIYSRGVSKLEEAQEGILFLDGVGEMDLPSQLKLVEVLQSGYITMKDSATPVPLDVRIIAAARRNLLEEVREGNFREDLYHLLQGIQIDLPPLREREYDLLLIAQKLLQSFCRQNNLPAKAFTASAQKKLLKHSYPGNIRELKAVVELAAMLSGSEQIVPDDIQLPESTATPLSEEKTLNQYIAETVQQYLDKYNYNVLCVADKLKIGKSTIYRMIRRKEVYMTGRRQA